MDYSSDLHEPRTNAEQSETGGDLRVSYESRRLPYYEHQLRPNADYSGVLECMSVEEARVLFEEMLKRFHLNDFMGFPLPPTGLPGFRAEGFTEDRPEARLIGIGLGYALAIIRSQPRAMHLRWQDAAEFIQEIENRIAGQTIDEWISSNTNDVERQKSAQRVYFIGAASGPVKIGIAVHPAERLRSLQTGHHERLSLLATCKGGQPQERAYHKQFAEHRLGGEWFGRCPEIEAEIERLKPESSLW